MQRPDPSYGAAHPSSKNEGLCGCASAPLGPAHTICCCYPFCTAHPPTHPFLQYDHALSDLGRLVAAVGASQMPGWIPVTLHASSTGSPASPCSCGILLWGGYVRRVSRSGIPQRKSLLARAPDERRAARHLELVQQSGLSRVLRSTAEPCRPESLLLLRELPDPLQGRIVVFAVRGKQETATLPHNLQPCHVRRPPAGRRAHCRRLSSLA